MKARLEHRRYLSQRFKVFDDFHYTGRWLNDEDIEILTKYGRWMMALERGWIAPITKDQERFVEVCNGKLEPTSSYERIWVRYTNYVQDEIAEANARQQNVEDLECALRILNREIDSPADQERYADEIKTIEDDLKDARKPVER